MQKTTELSQILGCQSIQKFFKQISKHKHTALAKATCFIDETMSNDLQSDRSLINNLMKAIKQQSGGAKPRESNLKLLNPNFASQQCIKINGNSFIFIDQHLHLEQSSQIV